MADPRQEAFQRATGWFQTAQSWLNAHPEVRIFNRQPTAEAGCKPNELLRARQAGPGLATRAGTAAMPAIVQNRLVAMVNPQPRATTVAIFSSPTPRDWSRPRRWMPMPRISAPPATNTCAAIRPRRSSSA